jgi:hypothetical protein
VEALRAAVATPPQKRIHRSGICELTLAALERALGPQAHRRCLIFVSHEDPDVTSGRYKAALEGTPWADRVVLGVKGAHLQVRFIEEAAPVGAHIVIADDNIEDIVVEEPSQEAQEQRKAQGVWNHMIHPLTCGPWRGALHGTGLRVAEEPLMSQLLGCAFPTWNAKRINDLQTALGNAKIRDVDKLKSALSETGRLNKVLGNSSQAPLRPKVLVDLRNGLKASLPPQQYLAVQSTKGMTDATSLLGAAGGNGKGASELEVLICRASREMSRVGANLWGVNPTKNHYFLYEFGKGLRERAAKARSGCHNQAKGVFRDTDTKIGLVYGAFFGFRVRHDARRYTRFGQVKDDVERTLRYFRCDNAVVRFTRYGIEKAHPPGKFLRTKGGISAESTAEKHEAEGRRALESLLEEFAAPYARLPRPGEKTSCGLVWKKESSDITKLKRKPERLAQPDSPVTPSLHENGAKRAKRPLTVAG